jgi:hypothetical protein
MNQLRKLLVNAIIEFSSDELTEEDYFKMASENDATLVERLIHITEYYREQYNN